nr:hypothetical protein [Deltaproteobacteria bacterium]
MPISRARIARDLAVCSAYVAQVRRRRAEAARLQRAASPRLREFMEGFQTWLQQQEAGAFGRAMTDLRTIMERWQADEDNGTNTMRPRSQLMRDVTARCQP